MAQVAGLDEAKDEVYRYLNFDEIDNYQDAADSVKKSA